MKLRRLGIIQTPTDDANSLILGISAEQHLYNLEEVDEKHRLNP